MVGKSAKAICLLIAVCTLISSVAYAFVYVTQTQTITQTIIRKWLSGWDNRFKITIDHYDVSSNLTDFPVLLHLSSSSGINGTSTAPIFSEIGSNSKKIAVTTTDAKTQCYVEIEKWVYPLSSTTETLRPDAVGDIAQISSVYPTSTPHWQTVDEQTANGDTDYVYTSSTSSSYQTDLYSIANHTSSGTINSVTVYFCFETSSSSYTAYARASIKTYGAIYNGTAESTTSTSYIVRSYTWNNNPSTGSSWTWTEIDALQAGVGLRISSFYGDSKCTQVYVEISYTPPGGEAWLWTKIPSISSLADTALYFYYDKDQADNTGYIGDVGSTIARNVWDTNYRGVWHLTENPAGTAPQMKDSTSNVNHGTSAGSMTSDDQVTANIDGGLDFDGSDDEIGCGNAATLQITTALTIEAWAKTSSTGTNRGIVNKQVNISPSYNGYQLRKQGSDNKYRFCVGDPATYYATSNSAYTDSNWHYIVGVKSSTNYLFVDGIQQTSTFTRTLTDSGANFEIGSSYSDYTSYEWLGQIDEVRVSNTNRNAAWIFASYETGRDHLITWISP